MRFNALVIEVSLHTERSMQLLILNDLGQGKFQDVQNFYMMQSGFS